MLTIFILFLVLIGRTLLFVLFIIIIIFLCVVIGFGWGVSRCLVFFVCFFMVLTVLGIVFGLLVFILS